MQPTRLRVNKLSVAGIDSIGPRNGHSATRVGQSIFIYGGFHSANRRFYGDMWEIDTGLFSLFMFRVFLLFIIFASITDCIFLHILFAVLRHFYFIEDTNEIHRFYVMHFIQICVCFREWKLSLSLVFIFDFLSEFYLITYRDSIYAPFSNLICVHMASFSAFLLKLHQTRHRLYFIQFEYIYLSR